MVCAPRCPLCREQLQGPFRVNHVLGDMIALLQIQSPMKPSPGFKSSRGFGKPWQEKEAPRGNSRPQLPNLSSPRQPLQQLSDQPPPRHAEAQPRAGLALAEIRPPSPRLALASWLPAIVPSVPQALVPIQYTRRVPTEVPTIEQAIEQALPGTIIIVARGTYHLRAPLLIKKQIRIRGEGAANEVSLLFTTSNGIVVGAGGYALLSSLSINCLHNNVGRDAPFGGGSGSSGSFGACVRGADARLSLDHCEVISTAVGVIAADAGRLDMQHTRVHSCRSHGVFLARNAKACLEENTVENNGGAGVVIDASTTEARRNTVCHNHGAGVQIVGKCAGSVKYNKVSHNGRRNVLLSRVPWWSRGSMQIVSNT